MPAIGITGGISTGKTSFCQCLRDIVPPARFFDADQEAHRLVDIDAQVKQEIRLEFGSGVFSGAGDLNREKLRAIVFGDTAKKRALEQVLHPRIRRKWSTEAETHRNSSDFFFADIPLLYETGGESLCDRVVVVACSPGVQLARLLGRHSTVDGRAGAPARNAAHGVAGGRRSITENEASEMIKAQMPIEEKMRRADHVVW